LYRSRSHSDLNLNKPSSYQSISMQYTDKQCSRGAQPGGAALAGWRLRAGPLRSAFL
jgi:hypothetical protein